MSNNIVTRAFAQAFIKDHPRPEDEIDRHNRFEIIKMLLRGLVIYEPKTKELILIDPLLRAMRGMPSL
jgi:hypothetical protein